MLRKALICLLLISLAGIAVAQELSNDVIDVKYEKKSTKMAMALSAIFPGAGQAYANPKSITTYIFPLLEAGLWYGYFHYNKQGDDATKDYNKHFLNIALAYGGQYELVDAVKKIGEKIIKYLLQVAQEKGCYKTILDCSDEVKPFYEKLGFKHNANALRFDHVQKYSFFGRLFFIFNKEAPTIITGKDKMIKISGV